MDTGFGTPGEHAKGSARRHSYGRLQYLHQPTEKKLLVDPMRINTLTLMIDADG